MGEGLLPLFYVSGGAILLEMLLPGEEREGAKGALHFMVVLALLAVLINPFLGFLKMGESGDFLGTLTVEGDGAVREEYEAVLDGALQSGGEREMKEGIYRLLESEYGIAKEHAEIRIRFDGAGEVSHIGIYLSGGALLQNPRELEAALTERLGVETEVR